MHISPYGSNHQRCQPAAAWAMKAMGYPTACMLLMDGASSTVDCVSGCIKLTCNVLKSFWNYYVFLELLKLSGHVHTTKSGFVSSKWHIPIYVSVLYVLSK